MAVCLLLMHIAREEEQDLLLHLEEGFIVGLKLVYLCTQFRK